MRIIKKVGKNAIFSIVSIISGLMKGFVAGILLVIAQQVTIFSPQVSSVWSQYAIIFEDIACWSYDNMAGTNKENQKNIRVSFETKHQNK